MDEELRAAWRRVKSTGLVPDYFHYWELCQRSSSTPNCFPDAVGLLDNKTGVLCPHCMFTTKFWNDVDLYRCIRIFFEKFSLTTNQTYIAISEGDDIDYQELEVIEKPLQGPDKKLDWPLYWPAMVLLVCYFDVAASHYPELFRISRLLVQNELCYGSSLEDYGFDESWPDESWTAEQGVEADLFDRFFSIRKMYFLVSNLAAQAGAAQIEIEVVPVGCNSVRPELGPINTLIRPYLRLTFLNGEGRATLDYETLFIFPAQSVSAYSTSQTNDYQRYLRNGTI